MPAETPCTAVTNGIASCILRTRFSPGLMSVSATCVHVRAEIFYGQKFCQALLPLHYKSDFNRIKNSIGTWWRNWKNFSPTENF